MAHDIYNDIVKTIEDTFDNVKDINKLSDTIVKVFKNMARNSKDFDVLMNQHRLDSEQWAKVIDQSIDSMDEFKQSLKDSVEEQIKRDYQIDELEKYHIDELEKRHKMMLNQNKQEIKVMEDRIKSAQFEQKIAAMSDSASDKLINGLSNLSSRIPVVGGMLTKRIEALGPTIAKKFDNWFKKGFAQKLMNKGGGALGGVGSLVGLSGIGLIATAAIGIFKAFQQAEKTVTDLVKQTGFLRSDLGNVTDDMMSASINTIQYGIEMDDVREITGALVSEFGAINIINREMIENAAKWSKAYGVGSDEIAKFVDVMHRSLGMTNKQMNTFVHTMDSKARSASVSVAMVMRDITKDANFLALYMDKTGDNIIKAAIQARKMGTSLDTAANIADTFLDLETSLLNTNELNLLLRSDLNAMDLHSMALNRDILGLQNKIVDTIEKQVDWDKLNVQEMKMIAQYSAMSVEDLAKQLKIRKDPAFKKSMEQEDAAKDNIDKINRSLRDQLTIWETIWLTIKKQVFPYFIQMGKWLSDNITPVVQRLSDALNTKGLKGFVSQLGDELTDLWVYLKDAFIMAMDASMEWLSNNWEFSIMGGGFVRKDKRTIDELTEPGWDKEKNKAAELVSQHTQDTPEVIKKGLEFLFGKTTPAPLPDKDEHGDLNVLKMSKKQFDEWIETQMMSNEPFATGGIVTKPTRALIGEAGPELILPLGGNGLNSVMSGGNVHFARGGAVVPLDQIDQLAATSSGITNTGTMMAANDPMVRRLREEAITDAARIYKREMQDEYRKKLGIESDNQREFASSVDKFNKGVGGFSGYTDEWLKQITGKSLWELVANKFGEALGLGPIGSVISQGMGAYNAYKRDGTRGVASYLSQKGNIFGEGGEFENSEIGQMVNGYASGGLRGVAGAAFDANMFDPTTAIGGIGSGVLGSYAQSGKSGIAEFLGQKAAGGLFNQSSVDPRSMIGQSLGVMASGDVKGGLKGLGTGMAKKFLGDKAISMASKFVPGLGQLSMVNDVLGMFGIDGMGMAMDAIKKIPGVGSVMGAFGIGTGATIESAWHPELLKYLYSQMGKKPGDKIEKKEIKKINKQIFGNEKAPGTKDGFSFYDMKGDEEKEDRTRSPYESWMLSQQIASQGGKAAKIAGGIENLLGSFMPQSSTSNTSSPISRGEVANSFVPKYDELEMLGTGGIVTSPTLSIVGEKGSEAVIPLNNNNGNNNLIKEIQLLREAIMYMSKRPIKLHMDGKKVSDIVAENFEYMSRQ